MKTGRRSRQPLSNIEIKLHYRNTLKDIIYCDKQDTATLIVNGWGALCQYNTSNIEYRSRAELATYNIEVIDVFQEQQAEFHNK